VGALPLDFRLLATRISMLAQSIRFRLTLWFVVVLALVLAGFSAFIYTRQMREFAVETSARLEAQARQLQSYYQYAMRQAFERAHGDTLPPSAMQSEMPLLQTDEALALLDPQGNVIQTIGPISDTDITRLRQAVPLGASTASFIYQLPNTRIAGGSTAGATPYEF
jgi:hypothetical protein